MPLDFGDWELNRPHSLEGQGAGSHTPLLCKPKQQQHVLQRNILMDSKHTLNLATGKQTLSCSAK